MNLNTYWKKGLRDCSRTDDSENETGLGILCCGCEACVNVCPKKAIGMKQDESGFYYPVIDKEKCVDCGLCVKKCQMAEKEAVTADKIITTSSKPKVYAAVNRDKQKLKKSSSGGAAYALGRYILAAGGSVFGAVYDDDMNVVHKEIRDIGELVKMQGSKYVQSRIGDSYSQVARMLRDGKTVLFTGTPCQIGGLYTFLGKDYENLYTMDVICYGVPSVGIYRDYIDYKENKCQAKIKDINFRNKMAGWGNSVTVLSFKDKKDLVKFSDDDEWYLVFLSHAATRESCHHCRYTHLKRASDITVGDFWGIEKYDNKIDTFDGLSKIMVNTQKGQELFEKIEKELKYKEMPLKSAIRPNLKNPPRPSEKREKFLKDYKEKGFEYAYTQNIKKKIRLRTKVKRWLVIKKKALGL